MPVDVLTARDPKEICKTLIKQGLITTAKAKEILSKQDKAIQKLARERGVTAAGLNDGAVSIIDVITSTIIGRNDGQVGMVDEDAIYHALANECGYGYRKIDPLKLDLNLVTTTIPHNFAKKHLILPIDIMVRRRTDCLREVKAELEAYN